jgi:hypothetical protein
MAEWPKVTNNNNNEIESVNSSSGDDGHDDGYSMLYSMRRRTRQEVQTGENSYTPQYSV